MELCRQSENKAADNGAISLLNTADTPAPDENHAGLTP
jgi:hypothetical protein